MNIAAYVQVRRTLAPTGVGKHIHQMLTLIAAMPGVRLRLFTAREELDGSGRIRADSSLAGMPADSYPLSRKWMERMWRFTGRPLADRWIGDADWIYCTAESHVPSKRAKVAVTAHAIYWFEPDYPDYNERPCREARLILGSTFRAAFRHSEIVFVVSQYLSRRISEIFDVDPKKIVVVGNGVEDIYYDMFDAPDETVPDPLEGRPYLLAIGGLATVKGGDYLLSLARELARRKSDLTIAVAGPGEDAYVEEAKTVPNVRQLGYVGIDRLPMLVKRATAVVHLSRYESFGIPVVEAMAAGTSAIGANVAALPEVIGDGGVIVNAKDSVAVADVVEKIRADVEYREQLIAAGRRRAEHFRWRDCAERALAAMKSRL